MKEGSCKSYCPWDEADTYPLATRECMDFDANHSEFCTNELSPYEGAPCPWRGRPDLEKGGGEPSIG